jgi:hypothetical protein
MCGGRSYRTHRDSILCRVTILHTDHVNSAALLLPVTHSYTQCYLLLYKHTNLNLSSPSLLAFYVDSARRKLRAVSIAIESAQGGVTQTGWVGLLWP